MAHHIKTKRRKNAMYKLITHSIIEEHFDDKPENYQSLQRLKNQVNQHNEEDVVKVEIPLLIRLLEYSREDAKGDVDLHFVAERAIELSEDGEVLTMEHYDKLVGNNPNNGEPSQEPPPPPPPPHMNKWQR